MKKIALFLVLCLFLFGCDEEEIQQNNLSIDYQKEIVSMCESKANYNDTIEEYPDYYKREFKDGNVLLIYYVDDKVVLLIFNENGERVIANYRDISSLEKNDFKEIKKGMNIQNIIDLDKNGYYGDRYASSREYPLKYSEHYTKDKYFVRIDYDDKYNAKDIRYEELKKNY